MMISRHIAARAGVLTLAALALASCGESTAPLNLSPDQLQSIGESVGAEIEAGVRQLTAQDVMSTNGGAPSFSRQPAASAMMTRGLAFSRAENRSAAPAADCGVPSQNPPTDTDADQVPDNLSVTFALPACHFDNLGTSFDITGVLRVSDPEPGTAGMALAFSLDNFRLSFSGTEGSGFVRRDGSASVAASPSGLSQTVDWSDYGEVSGVPSVGADINWTATFAAAQAQTITAGQPLPDGSYQANGTVSYREGHRTASFSVTTLAPLQYSASCAAGIDQGTAITPFSAGRIRVMVTSQEGQAYVDVTYAGCNSATVVVGQ